MDFFLLFLIVENLNSLIKYYSLYETRPTHYPNQKGSSLYNIARIVFNLHVLLALFDWVTSPNHVTFETTYIIISIKTGLKHLIIIE